MGQAAIAVHQELQFQRVSPLVIEMWVWSPSFIPPHIWLRKDLASKRQCSFLSTFGSQCCIHHVPHVMTLPIFLCIKSISWRGAFMIDKSSHNFIHWNYVRKCLQHICHILLWISFEFDYVLWLVIMYMCKFLMSNIHYICQKLSGICKEWHLSHKQCSAVCFNLNKLW